MNQLIKNVYTVYNKYLEEYNKQRAEKIELAYVGECQDFYVFAGDWQSLFLINNEGGIEIYLKNENPKTVADIEVAKNWDYSTRAIRTFNFKKFIKWLNKRNTLVKQINWTNLKTIHHIQKCISKIQPFDADFEIDEKTGKIYASKVCSIGGMNYLVDTYEDNDRPYCIIEERNERYRFYLPDTKPKTQKEMEIVPDFPFKKELYEKQIKDIKHYNMECISERSDGEKHLRYYELLLLYRAHNPSIEVEPIKEHEPFRNVYMKSWSFCDFAVKEYARQNNVNPYKILAEMFDKGYINDETRIDYRKKADFIKEYSYLCEDVKI